jgi:hypothetical protein
MTVSSVRLLALMLMFPVLLILALAVAVVGCAQPTSPSPPQVLASDLVVPAFGIAVDSTTVYVSPLDPGPLLAIPVGGGAATPVGVQAEGRALAVDEQRLYWSDGSSILACDKSNCTGSTVILARSQVGVLDITLDDTNVYWGTVTGTQGPGHIMKVDKHGGTPVDGGGTPIDGAAPDGSPALDSSAATGGAAPVEISASNWPYNVAVDAASIYWIEEASGPFQMHSGVMKAPIAGGLVVQLAVDDSYEPMGLALDDNNVYFMNGSGALFTVSKNGGPTHVMLSNLGMIPEGLVTDGTNLYIGANDKLVKVPLAGGFATALATDLISGSFIALDATSVYLAYGDSVLKVAK